MLAANKDNHLFAYSAKFIPKQRAESKIRDAKKREAVLAIEIKRIEERINMDNFTRVTQEEARKLWGL
jgi:hypothetical protein